MMLNVKEKQIAGFAVTWLNECGEDEVEFCDSFDELIEVQKEREAQGHLTKIFAEIINAEAIIENSKAVENV